jgi:hypothetical protein
VTQDSTHDPAGAGPPAPAVVSAHPGRTGADAGRPASARVVPEDARTELDRIGRRWAELPLAQAQARMPVLRRLLGDLAVRSAGASAQVPDLGPGVVVEQLTVLVHDAYLAGRGEGITVLLTETRRAIG